MGLRVWAVWMCTAVRARRAVVAWWTRPVTNPRPILGSRRVRYAPGADIYGRHDRSVGEQTVPLADLLAQLTVPVAPRPRREPQLLGTDPLYVWTHPERYGPPQPPPEMAATAGWFDDETGEVA